MIISVFLGLIELTTFAGNLCPGRYFTLTCVSLMISVSFLPSIISSNTYIVTRSSKCGKRAALAPTIFAIAEPLEEMSNNAIECAAVYMVGRWLEGKRTKRLFKFVTLKWNGVSFQFFGNIPHSFSRQIWKSTRKWMACNWPMAKFEPFRRAFQKGFHISMAENGWICSETGYVMNQRYCLRNPCVLRVRMQLPLFLKNWRLREIFAFNHGRACGMNKNDNGFVETYQLPEPTMHTFVLSLAIVNKWYPLSRTSNDQLNDTPNENCTLLRRNKSGKIKKREWKKWNLIRMCSVGLVTLQIHIQSHTHW